MMNTPWWPALYSLGCFNTVTVLTCATLLISFMISKFIFTGNKIPCPPLPCLQQRWYLFGLDTVYQDINDLRNHRSSLCSLLRHQRLGQTYISGILGQQTVHTIDPRDILAITTENFEDYGKGDWVQIIARYMGRGVLVNDGDMWRASRALLTPLFRRNKAADVKMFEPHVDRLITHLRRQTGKFMDFRRASQMVVLDITTDMLCAKSTLSLAQPSPSESSFPTKRLFLDLIDELEPYGNLAIELGPLSLPVFVWNYRRIMGLVHGLQSFFREAVQDAIGAGVNCEQASIIQHMLSQRRSPEEVQGELSNIFFAAFDTTTALLTNLFDCAARDRTVLAHLQAELAANTGSDISQLVYLRATVFETLRLHSPVTYHMRKARRDTVFPHGAQTPNGEFVPLFVPKGTSVVWSTYALNRSSAVCGDSDWAEFRPERWLGSSLEGSGEQRHLAVLENFMPFGSGPRNCLGQQFALHLTSYVAARVLMSFSSMELRSPDEAFEEAAAVTHYNGRGTWIKFS